MEEKNIIYFIMSHTVETQNGREYVCPAKPNPSMGEEFCNNIQREHDEVQKWITENPEKFVLAKYGHYSPANEYRTIMCDCSLKGFIEVRATGDIKADNVCTNGKTGTIYTRFGRGEVSYADIIKIFKEGDKNPDYGRASNFLMYDMVNILSSYLQHENRDCFIRSAKFIVDEFKKHNK